MLRDAGFATFVVEKLPHDDMNYYYIARKSELIASSAQACISSRSCTYTSNLMPCASGSSSE